MYQFYSLPSIAEYYFRVNGRYDDCYQMNGSLGAFFQNFVHGERVMTRRNKTQQIMKLLEDFDAVSLYPSAMALFNGFLRGLPKRITTKNYDDIKHYDGYFLKLVITKVGKHRPFPTMCYTDSKDKIKNWSNEMVGRVCFLDKYGLEDAIEFQNIEFEILDGHYYDEGFNTTIKDKIRDIFKYIPYIKK